MYLVNFASGGIYTEVQARQKNLLKPYVQGFFEYNAEVLHDFYLKHQNIIDTSLTGWGYCIWKPYIILDALQQIPYNRYVFYSDVADEIYNPDFWSWAETQVQHLGGHFFNLNYYKHGEWTKRDCFLTMGCDTPSYWDHRQLEAGTIILQNNPENINLMEEWYSWCQNPLALDKNPNQLGKPNLPRYQDHRTDQSILTNLIIKRGWPTEYMENIRAYIKYNEFDKQLPMDKHTR